MEQVNVKILKVNVWDVILRTLELKPQYILLFFVKKLFVCILLKGLKGDQGPMGNRGEKGCAGTSLGKNSHHLLYLFFFFSILYFFCISLYFFCISLRFVVVFFSVVYFFYFIAMFLLNFFHVFFSITPHFLHLVILSIVVVFKEFILLLSIPFAHAIFIYLIFFISFFWNLFSAIS